MFTLFSPYNQKGELFMNNSKKNNYKEREQILKLSSQGKSQREIAEAIGKNQSNISRELRRHGMNRNTYSAIMA